MVTSLLQNVKKLIHNPKETRITPAFDLVARISSVNCMLERRFDCSMLYKSRIAKQNMYNQCISNFIFSHSEKMKMKGNGRKKGSGIYEVLL